MHVDSFVLPMKIPTRSPCLGCEASLNDMAVQIPMQLQPLDFSKVWRLEKNGCLVKLRGSEAVLAFPVKVSGHIYFRSTLAQVLF